MVSKTLGAFIVTGVFLAVVPAASGQPLGSFSWQLSPWCNVVTLAVTQNGSIYRLEGFDDQCGTAQRGIVTGLAVPNTDGTFELGLTFVSATGATPSHMDITLSVATLGGPWRDSAGSVGTFIFNPGAVGGPPRPAGLGGAAIDATQVQRRITGTCGAGEFIQAVAQDGTVSCATDAAGNGDITSVAAGLGLVGGGASGAVALDVIFDGPGLSNRVARSDHRHQVADESVAIGGGAIASNLGSANIAIGTSALAGTSGAGNVAIGLASMLSASTAQGNTAVGTIAMRNLTTGASNVAVGFSALQSVTTGGNNTAVGAESLEGLTTGNNNTAVGSGALNNVTAGFGSTAVGYQSLNALTGGSSNVAVGQSTLRLTTTGLQNTAVGSAALTSNVTGANNVAIGASALSDATGSSNIAIGSQAMNDVTSGADNIAIGLLAGDDLTTGSDNIYIGAEAVLNNEDGTIRIGDADQDRAFIAGIRGVGTGVANAVAVLIDSNGQLGTINSSRRFKDDIADLGDRSAAIFRLRPVQFRYKTPVSDGSRPLEYGLIAEEVNEVMPELVAHGADGAIETVKYQVLPTLLLAEVQRLERERTAMLRTQAALQRAHDDEIAALKAELAELRMLIDRRR